MSNSSAVVLRARQSDLEFAREAIGLSNFTDDTALTNFLANPSHYFLVAIDDDRVVGSLYGYALQRPDRGQPQFFLYSIDVRPECWNRGIGTALVKQFVDEGRRAGAFEIWVLTNESNKAAMAMYANAGLQRRNVGDVCLELALTR